MMITKRFERVDVCAECGLCNGKRCERAKMTPRSYDGIRFTSDGFDCALPVSIDSHSHCSYGCLYCFSDNLVQHREQTTRRIGQTSLKRVESIFAGVPGVYADKFRMALKYDRRNTNGYPCPVQLGAICDPCDHIERQQGWLLEFIKLAIKYNQPVRMSTKGNIFQVKEYINAIAQRPELFWVAFSIITPDDEIIRRVDRVAPDATERLKTMKVLSDIGVKTSLRFRPILPGISDATKNEPKAYKVLINKAAASGAVAISYECGFVPGGLTQDTKARWDKLSDIAGVPFYDLYSKMGSKMACMRPAYAWTENIMHAIKDEAKACGLTIGVSDPVWKQLGETGCCCGILPDDPVFGNWQTESATNQLLLARDTGKEIGPDDIIPAWAKVTLQCDLCNLGAGPLVVFDKKHYTWEMFLRDTWNNKKKQRGPLNYFQGALQPTRVDKNGDWFYKYVGLERQYPKKSAYWSV